MTGICSWFCSPEGVINGSCENYGFFLTWGWPFQDCGGWLAGCVQGQELGACAPHLKGFILLGGFKDTLLVVSILVMFNLFYLFIFYLFKVGNKNIQLKVYRKNSFFI